MRGAVAAALIALTLGAAPALAADGAAFNVMGYSQDGRYFAFEQYGVQDGSGFPYWDIFAIDLEKDAFVPGSPVRARIDSETASLADARAAARDKAGAVLGPLGITVPGQLLAANFTTEVQDGRSSLRFTRFYPSMGAVPSDPATSYLTLHELSLSTADMEAKDLGATHCYEADGPYKGFTLTLKDVKLNQSHVIHKDAAIPASRGCPVGYALTAVAASMGSPDADRLVAFISVYTRGFEGIDERFIAVPFTLSD